MDSEKTKVVRTPAGAPASQRKPISLSSKLGLGALGVAGAAAVAELLMSMSSKDVHNAGKLHHSAAATPTTPHHNMHHPVIVVHDVAPQASHIQDSMTFKDAFAVAREEVGPGGVFNWHGQVYNTYTNNEFYVMTHDQKHDYVASLGDLVAHPSNISAHEVDILNIDHGDSTIPPEEHASTGTHDAGDTSHAAIDTTHAATGATEHLIKEEDVDGTDGHKMHLGVFMINNETVIKVDTDNDGTYDLVLTKHDDGSGHLHNNSTGEDTDLSTSEMEELFHQENTETAHDHSTTVETADHPVGDTDYSGTHGGHYNDDNNDHHQHLHDNSHNDFDHNANMSQFD